MARHVGFDDAGCCYHIVWYGFNRQRVFYGSRDCVLYLDLLMDALLRCGVFLHAYVLRENHVQLLVSPGRTGGISRMLRQLCGRYSDVFSRHDGHPGIVWDESNLAHSIDSDEQLLRCYSAIELDPLRNPLVSDPSAYHWSSYAFNAMGVENDLITPHPAYLSLDPDEHTRRAIYRDLNLRARGQIFGPAERTGGQCWPPVGVGATVSGRTLWRGVCHAIQLSGGNV